MARLGVAVVWLGNNCPAPDLPKCPGLTAVWLMSPLWPAIRLHHQTLDAISTHQTSHRDWYNDTALTRALGRCAGRGAPRRAARVPEI